MAAIKDYESQISPLAPLPGSSPERLRAQPEDFGGGQGMAVAGHDFAAAADTLDKVQQQQDITNVTVQMAQARQQWTSELNSRYATSKPGDPNFATNFNNDFNAYMEAVGNNAQTRGGQAAFQRAKAELTSTMLEKSATLQVHSAGVAAKQNYETAMDANRSTLVTDPTQFPSVLADADHALNDPNGPYYAMGPDARAALQRQTHEQLALSAVQGNIKNDPEGTLKQLQDGKWDQWLTGPARNAAENSALRMVQAQEVEQRRLEAAQEKAENKARQATADGFVKKMVADPTSVSAIDVANSNLKPETKLQWLGILRGEAARATGDKVESTQGNFVAALAGGTLTKEDILASNLPAVGSGSKEQFIGLVTARENRQANDDAGTAIAKQQDDFVSRLAAGTLNKDDIVNSKLPAVGSGSKEQFLGVLEAQRTKATAADAAEQKAKNVATFNDLFARIHMPDGDPRKIVDENYLNLYAAQGEITMSEMETLRKEINGKTTQQGRTDAELKLSRFEEIHKSLSQNNELLHWHDPKGEKIYNDWLHDALPEFDRRRAAGESVGQILDPKSPNYIGKSAIPRPMAVWMKDMMDAGTDPNALPYGGRPPAAAAGEGKVDISKATRSGTMKDGTKAYEIDGKWMRADGTVVK